MRGATRGRMRGDDGGGEVVAVEEKRDKPSRQKENKP